MQTSKKILLVGNTAWSMYNFRLGVAKALRASGYEVIIAAPFDHTSTLISVEGFQHLHIEMDNKGMSPLRDLKLLKDLYSIYRRIKPDLIVHYTIKPNIYGGFAARLAGIKTISFVTGLGSVFVKPSLITRLVEQLYTLAFAGSKRVWFLNDQDYDYFVKRKIVRQSIAEVLPGEGVDTSFFKADQHVPAPNTRPAAFRFLYLGRILKDKGILELVEAGKIIKARHPEVEVQLLGYIDALNPSAIKQSEVDSWVEQGLISYLGQSTDVRVHISAADCIVLPSYREGISRTLLEAASMEKPIIATDVPGCREIVDDGSTGFLCRIKDPVDLAQKMEMLIGMDVEARREMGRRARLKVLREFDEQLIIEKYLDTLSRIA